MSIEKIFKTIYDASVLIGISSGFGYFINMNDPSTSITDYLKWVIILSGSIYLKDYMQREEILKRIDSLNSKKDTSSKNLNLKKDNKKNLDLKSKRIVNLANPVGDKDAVNKSYADGKVKTTLNSLVSKAGDKMTGDLDMSGNEIKNLKEASSSMQHSLRTLITLTKPSTNVTPFYRHGGKITSLGDLITPSTERWKTISNTF